LAGDSSGLTGWGGDRAKSPGLKSESNFKGLNEPIRRWRECQSRDLGKSGNADEGQEARKNGQKPTDVPKQGEQTVSEAKEEQHESLTPHDPGENARNEKVRSAPNDPSQGRPSAGRKFKKKRESARSSSGRQTAIWVKRKGERLCLETSGSLGN